MACGDGTMRRELAPESACGLEHVALLDDELIELVALVRVDHAERNAELCRIICEHDERMAIGYGPDEQVEAEQRVRDEKAEGAQRAAQFRPRPAGRARQEETRHGSPKHHEQQSCVDGHNELESERAQVRYVESARRREYGAHG